MPSTCTPSPAGSVADRAPCGRWPAGVDLLCIGNPCFPEPYDGEAVFGSIRDEIIGAMAAGELAVERVEEAAARIAALKEWLASAVPRAADAEAK